MGNYLVSISDRCKSIKEKQGTPADEGYENLVDDEATEWLYCLSLNRIRVAAVDATLVREQGLVALLYRWKERAGVEEVRKWTDAQLECDEFVAAVAGDVISEMWSHGAGLGGMSDRVSIKTKYVHLQPLEPLLDLDQFRGRVKAMLDAPETRQSHRSILMQFQAAPERDPARF